MQSISFKVKASDKRNELQFEVQRRTRMQIFRDRRKTLDRKAKHKRGYEW